MAAVKLAVLFSQIGRSTNRGAKPLDKKMINQSTFIKGAWLKMVSQTVPAVNTCGN